VTSRLDLPAEPTSPGRARRFVTEALDGVATDAALAALLVSELVTNAVLHARTSFEVVVETDPTRVQVSVCDRSPVRPALRHYDRYAATGRGLHLVEALADRWGVDVEGHRKRVWFELRVAGAPAEDRRVVGAAAAAPRRLVPRLRVRRFVDRRRGARPRTRRR
jgi:anti-sigma regulatory factor (Ser/Thr protein kinase)